MSATARICVEIIGERQRQIAKGQHLKHDHIQYRDTLIYIAASMIREIEELDAIADKRPDSQ